MGAINYMGPGRFITGGAGITPLLAILRWLRRTGQEQGNTRLFSNRAYADIIQEAELRNILGSHAIFYLTQETRDGFRQGQLNQEELSVYAGDTALYFYICGPDKMVTDLADSLRQLAVNDDRIVLEA
jgi:ferredoxin-NADP reductase